MEQTNYVSYLRQSTKKQSLSNLGIEAQRETKLAEALDLCRKTKSTLIVAKLDRLSRNVAFTSKLLESDVEIKFCDFPEANRLVLHIIASIAEYEAGLISQRTKQALKAKKARGVSLGKPENLVNNLGKAITKSNLTNRQKALENDNNRRAIAMLKVMATQDLSLSEMARRLNEEGFVTSRGKQFTAWQVSVLLKRYNLK